MKGNIIGCSLLLGLVSTGCFVYLLTADEPNGTALLLVAIAPHLSNVSQEIIG
ncbi:MAG: hypothetical protein IIC82_09745 [Chloroflexi bacterium]|nr:hypothetical protein [Chloroflexota bacterium]